MRLSLPYPPSVNSYWRHTRTGQTYISEAGQEFRHAVRVLMLGTQPIDGPLSVEVELWPPDRRRRDIDNPLKGLLDALQHGGAYRDDNQIERLLIERRAVLPPGKCEVSIEELN